MPASIPNSVQETLSLFRAGWDLHVLREAFFGVKRFDDFQRNLGIGRGVLAERLRNLVDGEILERRRYQERPARFEYILTQRGLELYPIFIAMLRWGDRWLASETPSLVLTHELCGRTTMPVMVCEHCNEPIDAREMRYAAPTASRDGRRDARVPRS